MVDRDGLSWFDSMALAVGRLVLGLAAIASLVFLCSALIMGAGVLLTGKP